MPTSINGIGTELVQASKVRKLNGEAKYDAVEAFMIFGLCIIPYKALHVVSEVATGGKIHYGSFPLAFKKEIVALAFLRSWGSMLLLFGVCLSALLAFVFYTMDRAVNEADRIWLISFVIAAIVGLILRVVHYVASREQEWIKDTMGPTEFGFADPFFFEKEMAKSLLVDIEKEEGQGALQAATDEIGKGNFSKALFLVRLCQNVGTSGSLRNSYQRIRAGAGRGPGKTASSPRWR